MSLKCRLVCCVVSARVQTTVHVDVPFTNHNGNELGHMNASDYRQAQWLEYLLLVVALRTARAKRNKQQRMRPKRLMRSVASASSLERKQIGCDHVWIRSNTASALVSVGQTEGSSSCHAVRTVLVDTKRRARSPFCSTVP